MKWIVVKRNYHGEEAAAMRRWVFGVEGETRGICECWDEASADRIASALNAFGDAARDSVDCQNKACESFTEDFGQNCCAGGFFIPKLFSCEKFQPLEGGAPGGPSLPEAEGGA